MAAVLLAAALIQLALGYRLEVFGVAPNLVVVVVVAVAWTSGPSAALCAACAGGLLLDLGSSGAIGPHALALLPGAYVAGLVPRFRADWINMALASGGAAGATLIYATVLFAFGEPVRLGAEAAIYNLLLAPPALYLVRAVGLGRITRRAQA